jgi:hypothetical protein
LIGTPGGEAVHRSDRKAGGEIACRPLERTISYVAELLAGRACLAATHEWDATCHISAQKNLVELLFDEVY